jgi:peptide deformylase
MAGDEKVGSGKSFQRWFPTKIVPVEEIPQSSSLENFDKDNIQNYCKLAVALQILCITKSGIGLAAVQCGISNRLVIVSQDGMNYRNFIDCNYIGIGEKLDSLESCISILDKNGDLRRFLVKRYKKIQVKGFEIFSNNITMQFKEVDETFEGLFAVVLQHEIDHTEGTLISDIGKEVEVLN